MEDRCARGALRLRFEAEGMARLRFEAEGMARLRFEAEGMARKKGYWLFVSLPDRFDMRIFTYFLVH